MTPSPLDELADISRGFVITHVRRDPEKVEPPGDR